MSYDLRIAEMNIKRFNELNTIIRRHLPICSCGMREDGQWCWYICNGSMYYEEDFDSIPFPGDDVTVEEFEALILLRKL